MDDYLAAWWINEPFRVLDCTSEVDGAVAILITGEDIARDCKQPPIWLVGSSNSQSGAGWTGWDDPTKMFARSAGRKIWKKTELTPADMDVACMYDCFTYTVMATMEGFGFCEKVSRQVLFHRTRHLWRCWRSTRTAVCCPRATSTD